MHAAEAAAAKNPKAAQSNAPLTESQLKFQKLVEDAKKRDAAQLGAAAAKRAERDKIYERDTERLARESAEKKGREPDGVTGQTGNTAQVSAALRSCTHYHLIATN